MNSLIILIYLKALCHKVELFSAVTIAGTIIFLAIITLEGIYYQDVPSKYFKRGILCIILSLSIFTLIPGNSTFNALIATQVVNEVKDSKPINELGAKAYEVIDSFLDNELTKLKKENK